MRAGHDAPTAQIIRACGSFEEAAMRTCFLLVLLVIGSAVSPASACPSGYHPCGNYCCP
jgi:hypothetical protein